MVYSAYIIYYYIQDTGARRMANFCILSRNYTHLEGNRGKQTKEYNIEYIYDILRGGRLRCRYRD